MIKALTTKAAYNFNYFWAISNKWFSFPGCW